MKIEIGESLATSYLNHVKGCRVIQTNWKKSGNWTYTDQAKDRAISFYNEIKSKDEFKDIFLDKLQSQHFHNCFQNIFSNFLNFFGQI